MDVLIITHRDIYNSYGEYVLINRRAESLYKKYGIRTSLIGIYNKNKINSSDKNLFEKEHYQHISFIGYSIFSIIKDIIHVRKEVYKYLSDYKPNKVIISGLLTLILYNILKSFKKTSECELVYDCHGCIEEILEYGSTKVNSRFLCFIIYLILRITERKWINICDSVLVVSNEMKKYIESIYKKRELTFYFVPCGINRVFNNSNERLETRLTWRKLLGICEEDIVFVYSGGISKWQNIDKIFDFYNKISEELPDCKLCIFTLDTDYIKNIIEKKGYSHKGYIIRALNNSEVIYALSACDVGLLLRDDNLTNRVAFPNKFSEYINSGLNLVVSSSLKSPSIIVEKYNMGYVVDTNLTNINLELIKEIAQNRINKLDTIYETCNKIVMEELSYDKNLIKFAQHINNHKFTKYDKAVLEKDN